MHSLMPRLNLVQMLLLSSGLLPKPLAGVLMKYVLIMTLAVLIICQSIFNLAFTQDHSVFTLIVVLEKISIVQ